MEICLTSYLTSNLMTWRNPQGAEDNWKNPYSQDKGLVSQESQINNAGLFALRVITTEISLILLGVVATIESIVCAVFLLPCLFYNPKYYLSAVKISLSTLGWVAVNALWHNFTKINLYTSLSTACKYDYVLKKIEQPGVVSILEMSEMANIDGKDFLLDFVLKDMLENAEHRNNKDAIETLRAFYEFDQTTFISNFVLYKTFYIYVLKGSSYLLDQDPNYRIQENDAFLPNFMQTKKLLWTPEESALDNNAYQEITEEQINGDVMIERIQGRHIHQGAINFNVEKIEKSVGYKIIKEALTDQLANPIIYDKSAIDTMFLSLKNFDEARLNPKNKDLFTLFGKINPELLGSTFLMEDWPQAAQSMSQTLPPDLMKLIDPPIEE